MGQKLDMGFRRFAVTLLTAAAKIKFGTVKKIDEMPPKGSLIVCNHTSIWDFAHLISAIWPRSEMRFLATAVQYDKSKFTAFLFRHLGMIRKNQGARDLQAVKDMLKATKEGGTVIIYAAGMTSFDGREAWSALPGTGAMPKLLKTDVYAAITHGGFISHPRYAHRSFRGKVEVEIKRLYTAEEASKLKTEELQAGIDEALRFNDWDWQEKNMVPFRGMKHIDNISRTLYMCPVCKKEGSLRERKNALACECGFSAKRDKYGFFVSDNASCPRRMDKWVDLEINELKRQVEKDDFKLEESCALYRRAQNSAEEYAFVGNGTIRLDRTALSFNGENNSLSLDFSAFQFIILSDTDALIINTDLDNYRFVFEDTRLMTKWFFAHRLMKQMGMI